MDMPEKVSSVLTLFRSPRLWLCIFVIFCGGAAEVTMAQWSSGYLEQAMAIPKVWGDIFGAALFALLLRKKASGRTLGCLSLVFGCYAGGHLLTKGLHGVSYAPVQDLIFILLVGGALFLLFFGVFQLHRLSSAELE